MNFSNPMGPFKTTVITDDDGKVIGHIRRCRQGFIFTSLISSPWDSTMPGIDAKTNCRVFATREEAKAEAALIFNGEVA